MIFSEAFEVRERVKDSGVLKKWLADLKCEAEKYLAEGIENYTLADFMDYYETGERTGFERIYFSKRGRLAAFAMMIYVFKDKRFAAPLEETVVSICSEKTWARLHIYRMKGLEHVTHGLICLRLKQDLHYRK